MRQLFLVCLIYLFSFYSFSNNSDKNLSHVNICDEKDHLISGTVLNGISLQPISEAAVIIYNAQKEVVITVMTDNLGNFEVLLDNNEQYIIEYFHEDFNIRYKKIEKVNFALPDFIYLYLDPGVGIDFFMIEEKLDLTAIPHYIINSKYVLDVNNIYFVENEYFIEYEYKSILEEVVNILDNNKALKIEIAVHTSSGARENYNLELSSKRAKNIFDYFITKGIDISRLNYVGYGSSEPLIHNLEAQLKNGNDANRRVEFRILFK